MSFRYCPSLLTGVRQRSGYVQALVLSRILTARPNALYISRGLHQCRIRLTSMMVVTHAMKLGLTRSILCPLPALSQTCQRRARCLVKGDSHESAQLSSAQLTLPVRVHNPPSTQVFLIVIHQRPFNRAFKDLLESSFEFQQLSLIEERIMKFDCTIFN